jgi:hypothetical protein
LKKSDSIVIGGLMMFVGIISIPYTNRFAVASSDPILSFLVFLIFSIMPVGVGLFLVYATLRFKKPAADEIDDVQPDNINIHATDGMANLPKHIEIIVNDNGIALSTQGMSPQEIVASLELTKYYIISKHVRDGSPMDVVRRI